MIPSHPAKFSDSILRAINAMAAKHDLLDVPTVLDPFAGVGRIYEVFPQAVGVELLPRWAAADRRTVVGNSLYLRKLFPRKRFRLAVTSPCYANRMADHHKAKDPCGKCRGCGKREWWEEPHADPEMVWICYDPEGKVCSLCGGSGLSRRNTYRHRHGEEGWVSVDNAGTLQWGDAYRDFHERVWKSLLDVADPAGFDFLFNVSDHIRKKKRMPVERWHIECLTGLGLEVVDKRRVPTPRNKQGENYEARVASEGLYLLRG